MSKGMRWAGGEEGVQGGEVWDWGRVRWVSKGMRYGAGGG